MYMSSVSGSVSDYVFIHRLVLLPTIGSSQLLRLQLQMKMRQIKADDKARLNCVHSCIIQWSLKYS